MAGVPVSPETAPTFVAVYRAWSLIAGTIGSMPLKSFRKDGAEAPSKILEAPSRSQEPGEFIETLLVHMLGWGNAGATVARDGLAAAAKLDLVHPSRFTTKAAPITADNPTGLAHDVTQADGQVATLAPYPYGPFLHFPALSTDGLSGLSPVTVARETIGVGLAQELTAAKLYSSGLLSSWLVTSAEQLNEAEAKSIKAKLMSLVAGVRRAHEPIVVDADLKLERLSMSPLDAQFLESQQFSDSRVAMLYGIPPAMLGMTEKSTSFGAGLSEMDNWLAQYTLGLWAKRVEGRLSRLLPRGQKAKFVMDAVLRGTTRERYETYDIAIKAGFMTKDEARELENRPPLTDEQKAEAQPAAQGEEAPAVDVLVNAAGTLIRSGFEPGPSLDAVGLPQIAHTGLLPVTVQSPEALEPPKPAAPGAKSPNPQGDSDA